MVLSSWCRYSMNAHDADPGFIVNPNTNMVVFCSAPAYEKYTLPVRGTDREFVTVTVCPKHLADLILRYESLQSTGDAQPQPPTPLQRSANLEPDPDSTQVMQVGDHVYISPVTRTDWTDMGTDVKVERRGDSWIFTHGEE